MEKSTSLLRVKIADLVPYECAAKESSYHHLIGVFRRGETVPKPPEVLRLAGGRLIVKDGNSTVKAALDAGRQEIDVVEVTRPKQEMRSYEDTLKMRDRQSLTFQNLPILSSTERDRKTKEEQEELFKGM